MRFSYDITARYSLRRFAWCVLGSAVHLQCMCTQIGTIHRKFAWCNMLCIYKGFVWCMKFHLRFGECAVELLGNFVIISITGTKWCLNYIEYISVFIGNCYIYRLITWKLPLMCYRHAISREVNLNMLSIHMCLLVTVFFVFFVGFMWQYTHLLIPRHF